jgi:hypothetical protein
LVFPRPSGGQGQTLGPRWAAQSWQRTAQLQALPTGPRWVLHFERAGAANKRVSPVPEKRGVKGGVHVGLCALISPTLERREISWKGPCSHLPTLPILEVTCPRRAWPGRTVSPLPSKPQIWVPPQATFHPLSDWKPGQGGPKAHVSRVLAVLPRSSHPLGLGTL